MTPDKVVSHDKDADVNAIKPTQIQVITSGPTQEKETILQTSSETANNPVDETQTATVGAGQQQATERVRPDPRVRPQPKRLPDTSDHGPVAAQPQQFKRQKRVLAANASSTSGTSSTLPDRNPLSTGADFDCEVHIRLQSPLSIVSTRDMSQTHTMLTFTQFGTNIPLSSPDAPRRYSALRRRIDSQKTASARTTVPNRAISSRPTVADTSRLASSSTGSTPLPGTLSGSDKIGSHAYFDTYFSNRAAQRDGEHSVDQCLPLTSNAPQTDVHSLDTDEGMKTSSSISADLLRNVRGEDDRPQMGGGPSPDAPTAGLSTMGPPQRYPAQAPLSRNDDNVASRAGDATETATSDTGSNGQDSGWKIPPEFRELLSLALNAMDTPTQAVSGAQAQPILPPEIRSLPSYQAEQRLVSQVAPFPQESPRQKERARKQAEARERRKRRRESTEKLSLEQIEAEDGVEIYENVLKLTEQFPGERVCDLYSTLTLKGGDFDATVEYLNKAG